MCFSQILTGTNIFLFIRLKELGLKVHHHVSRNRWGGGGEGSLLTACVCVSLATSPDRQGISLAPNGLKMSACKREGRGGGARAEEDRPPGETVRVQSELSCMSSSCSD